MINVTTEDIVPGSTIRNTADPREVDLTALLAIANAMGGGKAEDVIYAQEKAGQRQLVNSDRLPTDAKPNDAAYEALGIVFGAADASDSLFRPATLPSGWRRQATDHDMWSKVVDQYGRERIAVFYKAAFYDRSAFMRLETPNSYLRTVVGYNNDTPVLDDQWLTAEIASDTLTALEGEAHNQAEEADGFAARPGASNPDYWVERAVEHRAEAARYAAARERISAQGESGPREPWSDPNDEVTGADWPTTDAEKITADVDAKTAEAAEL